MMPTNDLKYQVSIIILLISFYPSLQVQGQQCDCDASLRPEAILAKARLPFGDIGQSAIYDGEDSILIFSGNEPHARGIYRFNLTSEDIENIGQIPFKGTYAPITRLDGGSYLYFGNDKVAQRVLHYDPSSKVGEVVAEFQLNLLPHRFLFTSDDPSNSNKVYILGGGETRSSLGPIHIFEFDTRTFCSSLVQNITVERSAIVASLTSGEFVYVFRREGRDPVRIHRETLEVTMLNQTNLKFDGGYQATTVLTSKHAYVVSGYRPGNPFPVDGLLQYNPEGNDFKFIRIDGWPPGFNSAYGTAPAPVFVEKLNRIYFFGGRSNPDPMDGIWYIDVGLLEQ